MAVTTRAGADPNLMPGWYLKMISYTSLAYGATQSGANWIQAKGFQFNKKVSWGGVLCVATAQGTSGIVTNIVSQSDTNGSVVSCNLRNEQVGANIIRFYVLSKDPDLTVSWVS